MFGENIDTSPDEPNLAIPRSSVMGAYDIKIVDVNAECLTVAPTVISIYS